MSSESSAPVDTSGFTGTLIVVGLVVTLVLSLIVGVMAFEGVGTGNVKVVKHQGDVTGEVLSPGWHVITPLIEDTKTLPTRPQTYTMSHASGEGQESQRDDSVRVLTSDGLQVDVDVTVRYRITPADAPTFHEEYRGIKTAEARLIRPTVRSVLRTEGGNIDVTDIYTGEGQDRLKAAVEEALVQDFEGSGAVLDTVQIRNVRLPAEYAESIEAKKVKEQKIEEAEYEIQVAEKNKERDIIKAEAEAKSISIKGKALARNPEVLQLRYIEALKTNENTVYVTGSNSNMMLTKEVNNGTSAP